MALEVGQRVLRGIYELRRKIPTDPTAPHSLWEAEAGPGPSVVIKAWPFLSDVPHTPEQTSWYRELRVLYRLASTPEAERRLVTLIDAQPDPSARAFVLALRVPGTVRLSEVLTSRSKFGWLSGISETVLRANLWRGALTLVEGLGHVHRFQSIHRAVGAENVFLDPTQGPSSFRLGGFEWSARLTGTAIAIVPSPSFVAQANASLNSDWRDLGIILAQLFGVNPGPALDPHGLTRALRESSRLNEDEKAFISVLLSANGHGPLDRRDLTRACREIILSLERPSGLREADRLGVVVALRNRAGSTALANRVVETDPTLTTDQEDAIRDWIESDLAEAEILASGDPGAESYFLKGRRLPYRLWPATEKRGEDDIKTWNIGSLSIIDSIDERFVMRKRIPFRSVVKVYTHHNAAKHYEQIVKRTRSWQTVLPRIERPDYVDIPQLTFMRRFLAVTNHIEERIIETQVFPVEVIKHYTDAGGEPTYEYLLLKERPRVSPLPMAARAQTMLRYLREEDVRGSREVEVYVGPESGIELRRATRVQENEYWTLDATPSEAQQSEGQTITLRRPIVAGASFGPPLFLRARGLFGQVAVIGRRREGIELLASHTFLQRAIVLPDTVFIDTEVDQVPLPFPSVEKFDQTKVEAIRLAWRTRPIFCIQGPPGTGKTTLIGQFLRQVYEDDDSVQVLLSAQAHPAVDHLRDEVNKFIAERRVAQPGWVEPLAIRLRKLTRWEAQAEEDSASPSAVTKSVLLRCLTALEKRGPVADHLQKWHEYVKSQMAAVDGPTSATQDSSDDGDFQALVRRSANFVYCTSNAADLLRLAQSHQTYDWTIVEEAGKAHGFELVLPLQTGHRWLLIGDQFQLFPYRHEDFLYALDRLDKMVASNGGIQSFWEEMSPDERAAFVTAAKDWLYFFRELYETVERRPHRPLVQMLGLQHRMHPDIGSLVSHAFYWGELHNGTKDDNGKPMDRVIHRFVEPPAARDVAVVWVDVDEKPRARANGDPDEGYLVNSAEVAAVSEILQRLQTREGAEETVAVLTPYRGQLELLRTSLASGPKPAWARSPDGRRRTREEKVGVYTVDSFQGQQASTILISLVRNNIEKDTQSALGFLRYFERVNVMLSRAERLLIVVGSWEFFYAHLHAQSDKKGEVYAELKRLIDWFEQSVAQHKAFKGTLSEFCRGEGV